jgi:anthranilate phosphoribosyltransferase
MIKEAINALVEGKSLTFEETEGVMEEMMGGEATPAQIGAFVTALRIKGETVDEIAGLASVMRAKATPVKVSGPTIDIVGTGGDRSSSFNISTAAAFVVAGAGMKVAKHGNRAMTSQCGSADILEAAGVEIDLGADGVATCIEQAGIGFIFAPVFHPTMKHAAGPRREIGIRTVFNILGPLTNPARAEFQLLGVPGEELGGKIAAALHRLGTEHSLVVHSRDGLDEISTSGKSIIWEVDRNGVKPTHEISPRDFGFREVSLTEIKGGSPEENAGIMRRIFDGEKGSYRDVVVLNAAAALVAGNQAATLKDGISPAEEAIDSGRAREKLNGLVKISQSLG